MYEIVDGFVSIEDTGKVRTYGLRTPSGQVIMDISTNKKKVVSFAAALDRCGASEIHIMEFIDDFLG